MVIGLLPATAGATADAPEAGPRGWWSFDGSGARVTDRSGNGSHGDLVGGAKRHTGAVGPGLHLAGGEDRLELPGELFNRWQRLSVAAWLNPQAGGAGRFRTLLVAGSGEGGAEPRLWLGFNARSGNWLARLTTADGAHHRRGLMASAALDLWQHVVWVIDLPRGAVRLYVNGKRRATAAGLELDETRLAGDPRPFVRVGPSRAGGDDGWQGVLDELQIFARALAADEVASLYASSPPPATEPRPGVDPTVAVGHWRFDADRSPGVFPNAIGAAHAGRTSGAPRDVVGKVGRALAFDGRRDAIILSAEGLLDGWNAASITAWVWPEKGGKGDWPTLIEKASAGGPKHPHVLWVGANRASGKLAFQIGTDLDENYFRSFGVRLPYGRWSHVAVLINLAARQTQLFVDGQPMAEPADLPILGRALARNPDGPCAIGAIAQGQNNYWRGRLDDVRVYRGILTADQIRGLTATGP